MQRVVQTTIFTTVSLKCGQNQMSVFETRRFDKIAVLTDHALLKFYLHPCGPQEMQSCIFYLVWITNKSWKISTKLLGSWQNYSVWRDSRSEPSYTPFDRSLHELSNDTKFKVKIRFGIRTSLFSFIFMWPSTWHRSDVRIREAASWADIRTSRHLHNHRFRTVKMTRSGPNS